jgi:hypothetical protein
MAKIKPDVMAQVQAGYEASRKHGSQNPHYATSTYGEAWDIGWYMGETGRSIEGLEKARGSQYRTPTGATFKVVYGRCGGVFFERTA